MKAQHPKPFFIFTALFSLNIVYWQILDGLKVDRKYISKLKKIIQRKRLACNIPLLIEQQVKFSEALITFSVNQCCWIQQFKIKGSTWFRIFDYLSYLLRYSYYPFTTASDNCLIPLIPYFLFSKCFYFWDPECKEEQVKYILQVLILSKHKQD